MFKFLKLFSNLKKVEEPVEDLENDEDMYIPVGILSFVSGSPAFRLHHNLNIYKLNDIFYVCRSYINGYTEDHNSLVYSEYSSTITNYTGIRSGVYIDSVCGYNNADVIPIDCISIKHNQRFGIFILNINGNRVILPGDGSKKNITAIVNMFSITIDNIDDIDLFCLYPLYGLYDEHINQTDMDIMSFSSLCYYLYNKYNVQHVNELLEIWYSDINRYRVIRYNDSIPSVAPTDILVDLPYILPFLSVKKRSGAYIVDTHDVVDNMLYKVMTSII
jgi:hypothetical protein